MLDSQILDIFYNKIVKEAADCKIDCYFIVNIGFNLIINNQLVSSCHNPNYEGLEIPTLKITNQDLFNTLLIEYVKKALEFYDEKNFSFLDDINLQVQNNLPNVKEEYKIKYIICMLIANASLSDFSNPIAYLNKRIAMFNHYFLSDEEKYIGRLESIEAKLYGKEEKSPIQAETPYCIKGYLKFDNDYILKLPDIYAGSDGEKSYLYGIQKTNKSDEQEEKPYLKQIRKGLIAKLNGAPEHFFLAVMLYLSLSSDKEIEIIPYLCIRWNAKRIAFLKKHQLNNQLSIEEINEKHDKIQNVLTDILMRYFTKLIDVSEGLDIIAVPFHIDSNLHLHMTDKFISRCQVFNELYSLIDELRNQKKLK